MASGISSTVPSNTITPAIISSFSNESLGGQGIQISAATTTSATWFSANLAVFTPFVVNSTFVCARIWWFNGAAVSGNVDAGIYNEAGTRLASIGSTAQSGTTAVQSAALAVTLVPGRYYMALALDNATGTLHVTNSNNGNRNWFGMAQQTTAFPLPSTATLATPATVGNMGIAMGITTRTFV